MPVLWCAFFITHMSWHDLVGPVKNRAYFQERRSRRPEQARFRGHIKELLVPAHESQWNSSSVSTTVLFHNKCTRDPKTEPLKEVRIRGRIGVFDRFLVYDFDYEVDTGRILHWVSLPVRLPFSVSLFNTMVYLYDTDAPDDHEAAIVALCVIGDAGALEIDALAKTTYVHDKLSKHTVYFFLECFLSLGAVYQKTHEALREMPYYDKVEVFTVFQNSPELLCYTSSARMHINRLGLLSADSLQRVMMQKPGAIRSDVNLAKKRVCFYQYVISARWIDHPYKKQSTRVLLTKKEERDLRAHPFFKKLFFDYRVLQLASFPVSPQEPHLSLTYLIRTNAIGRVYYIKEGLENLLERRNFMPSRKILTKKRIALGAPVEHDKDAKEEKEEEEEEEDQQDQRPWVDFPIPTKRHVAKVCRTLSDTQRSSVEKCVRSPVYMLTGGAGVGKTRTLRSIWLLRPFEYVIATPTGKAGDQVIKALRDQGPLPCTPMVDTVAYIVTLLTHMPEHSMHYTTALIIDEASCVSEQMLSSLLRLLPYLQQLILVGDVNQLGPIDPGFPFRDMLSHMTSCTTRLTQNFRAENDDLAYNSRCIVESRLNDMHFHLNYEMSFLPAYTFVRRTPDIKADVLRALNYLECVSGDSKTAVERNTQIITVSNSVCRQINSIIYAHRFNKQNESGAFWHVGQRVMFLKNYHDSNEEGGVSSAVRNGETGTILNIYDIKTKSCTTAPAPDRVDVEHTHLHRYPDSGYRRWLTVRTTGGLVKNVDLAAIKNTIIDGSCQTGHKSQGSEYRYVVLVINRQRPEGAHIINKNWIYTVCTRPMRALIVLYSECVVSNPLCSPTIQKLGSWASAATTLRPKIDTFLWNALTELHC